jgi:hypothetical protein
MTLSTPSSIVCRPRWATPRRPERLSYGPAVAEVAAILAPGARLDGGVGFMPWQCQVADVAGEVDPASGRFFYDTVVVVVPRQAGKTLSALATQIQRATIGRRQRGWYTAQTQKDAASKFRLEWAPLVQASALAPLIKVRQQAGSQGFTMSRVGSTINLFAPVERAIHGDQADCVMIDEGWAFDIVTGLALETSIRPAQATRRHRQLWLISAGGTEASTWLIKFQKLGRAAAEANTGRGIAYFEWSAADHLRDVDPYDRDLWWATHPALGYTIEEDTIRADAETMDPAEFARAYLCIPTAHLSDQKIPAQAWGFCCEPASEVLDPIALAFDVALERDAASIAVAGDDVDGRDAVEVVDNRAGTGWLADRVEELWLRWPTSAVVVDPYGPARSIADELERRGVIVTRATAGDVGAACGDFYDAVLEGRLRHRGQGLLDAAVGGAGTRPIGEAWGWARRLSTVDISPLVAATLARWGHREQGGPPAIN